MANRSMAKRRNRQKTMCQGCKIADGKAVQRIFPDGTKAYYHNNCLKKKLKYDQGKHIQLDES